VALQKVTSNQEVSTSKIINTKNSNQTEIPLNMIDPPQEIEIPRLKQSDKKGGAAGRQPSPAQQSTKRNPRLQSTTICISRSRADLANQFLMSGGLKKKAIRSDHTKPCREFVKNAHFCSLSKDCDCNSAFPNIDFLASRLHFQGIDSPRTHVSSLVVFCGEM
jgi:hypothetical protein